MPGLPLPAGPLERWEEASAEVSAPVVFVHVGLTFPFCEMGTNPPLWQATVRGLRPDIPTRTQSIQKLKLEGWAEK